MEVNLANYSYIFNFEETFSPYETKVWMVNNWTNCFYYCGLYMILIFGGQHYMASRPRFELRGILCLWNTLLATFSIIGFTRTAPELIHVLRHHGLHHSICSTRLVFFLPASQLSTSKISHMSTQQHSSLGQYWPQIEPQYWLMLVRRLAFYSQYWNIGPIFTKKKIISCLAECSQRGFHYYLYSQKRFLWGIQRKIF